MLSTHVVAALASLAETATGDFSIEDLLRDLCGVATLALQVDGAGVMISEPAGLRFIHAAPERVVDVESLQEILQRGPCWDAMSDGAAVIVDDITKSDRWPEFAEAAASAGLRATVAMPLLARGEAWGALDVYHNSKWAWTADQVSMVRLFAGVAASYLVMAFDRDLAGTARESLEHQASHDALTGLPGRTLLAGLLQRALASGRRRGTTVAVIFLDLDRFKNINDTLGHAAGDLVLIETARRLSRAVRENDTVVRLAGDEFVIVCEDLPHDPAHGTGTVQALGRRLETVLARPMQIAGTDVLVTASIGMAVAAEQSTAEVLLDDADGAMYLAKQRGRGKLVIVGAADAVPGADRRRALSQDLAVALERDQFRVHYQPIVDASPAHAVVAVEALLRWEHPAYGLLTAKEFIGVAEHSVSIGAIGRWVVNQACAQLAAWRAEFADLAPERVFVHLSSRELADPGLGAALNRALHDHGLRATDLGLEIVQNDLVDALLRPGILEHNRRGHPLTVDDFASGLSSLAALVNFPVRFAKLDRDFVAGLSQPTLPQPTRPHPAEQDPAQLQPAHRQDVLTSMIGIGHLLGFTLIAQGVETYEQELELVGHGCDLLQGYYFGRPQSGADLTANWAISQEAPA